MKKFDYILILFIFLFVIVLPIVVLVSPASTLSSKSLNKKIMEERQEYQVGWVYSRHNLTSNVKMKQHVFSYTLLENYDYKARNLPQLLLLCDSEANTFDLLVVDHDAKWKAVTSLGLDLDNNEVKPNNINEHSNFGDITEFFRLADNSNKLLVNVENRIYSSLEIGKYGDMAAHDNVCEREAKLKRIQ